MRSCVVALLGLWPALGAAPETRAVKPDPPIQCDACEAWNRTQEPFRVFGNTYYVGVAGLSSVLIASDGGLILLDGGLPQSAPRVDASIRKLGFRTQDVRLIVNSHAHYDHAGGIAALQRASGATVAASAKGAAAIRRGGLPADDPQYAGPKAGGFPLVERVREVADGETLRVGELALTAHLTPGHTPGGTTWTWRSCEGQRCLDLVYADSLNAISSPGFRFAGDATHPSVEAAFRRSIAVVAALPCDILLTGHLGLNGLESRLRRWREQPSVNPFVDPKACRTYAADAARRLDERIASERNAPAATRP